MSRHRIEMFIFDVAFWIIALMGSTVVVRLFTVSFFPFLGMIFVLAFLLALIHNRMNHAEAKAEWEAEKAALGRVDEYNG